LAILVFLALRTRSVQAGEVPPVLRGRALEIVDTQGKLRASIQVIQAGPSQRPDGSLPGTNGKTYPEPVALRLIRTDGRPSVKIATPEQGSGLDLSGGTDPSYIVPSADNGDPDDPLLFRFGNSAKRKRTLFGQSFPTCSFAWVRMGRSSLQKS